MSKILSTLAMIICMAFYYLWKIIKFIFGFLLALIEDVFTLLITDLSSLPAIFITAIITGVIQLVKHPLKHIHDSHTLAHGAVIVMRIGIISAVLLYLIGDILFIHLKIYWLAIIFIIYTIDELYSLIKFH